jgi:tetratricopeptide (TPR) repeat protein
MKEGAMFLPFLKVYDVMFQLKKKASVVMGKDSEIRILKYCLSFAEYQYGDRIIGQKQRERGGYGMDNLAIDQIFLGLCGAIGFDYQIKADRHSKISILKDAYTMAIYHYKKSLSIVVSWQTQLDSGERKDFIKGIDINFMRTMAESKLVSCYIELRNFEKAGDSYERAITFAKVIVVAEERTNFLYSTLCAKARLLHDQSKFVESRTIYEKVYDMLANLYHPDHPLVLKATNHLIGCLIIAKEYYDAER